MESLRNDVIHLVAFALAGFLAIYTFGFIHELGHVMASETKPDALCMSLQKPSFYVSGADNKVKTFLFGPILAALIFVPLGTVALVIGLFRKHTFLICMGIFFVVLSLAYLLPLPGTDMSKIWNIEVK
jgi:hypothetical protein